MSLAAEMILVCFWDSAELLVLCWQCPPVTQMSQLGSWLLLSGSEVWTLWYWIFSLEPPGAIWMVWPGSLPSPLPSFAGLRRAIAFAFLLGHYLWGHYRASVLIGGDEWVLLEVFDHPHWVKLDVYSKAYPLLTPEFLRTDVTFFKSIVENLTRDFTIIGLSL